MRRITVLAAAGAVAVVVGLVSFSLGGARTVQQPPVATTVPAKIAEPEVVTTGTIADKPRSGPTLPRRFRPSSRQP